MSDSKCTYNTAKLDRESLKQYLQRTISFCDQKIHAPNRVELKDKFEAGRLLATCIGHYTALIKDAQLDDHERRLAKLEEQPKENKAVGDETY
ncbi:MAG: hypothetical protein LBI79_10580 [Nitrososphaerota archaeon]|jgi:hypothetical protein|nr:hypothetical protein [Nitrososphaerota archaeon]